MDWILLIALLIGAACFLAIVVGWWRIARRRELKRLERQTLRNLARQTQKDPDE